MRHRFAVVLVAATLVVVAGSVSAHHSVSGQYDASRPLTLTGVISKVDWINPHIYLHLDVKEKDGAVITWTLRGGGLGRFDQFADGDDASRRVDQGVAAGTARRSRDDQRDRGER